MMSSELKLGRSTALHSVSIFSLEMGPAMEISWHRLALLAQRVQGPIWNLVGGVGHTMVELLNRLCLISFGEHDRIIANPYRQEPANLRIPPFPQTPVQLFKSYSYPEILHFGLQSCVRHRNTRTEVRKKRVLVEHCVGMHFDKHEILNLGTFSVEISHPIQGQ